MRAEPEVTTYTNSNYITAFAFSGSDIWCATWGGIVRRDKSGETYECFTVDHGLPGHLFSSIGIDAENRVWVTHFNDGIYWYDGVTWTKNDTYVSNFAIMANDDSGCTWFGTTMGLFRYDGAVFRLFTTADGLSDNNVKTLTFGGNGVLWAGTRHGLSRFDGITWGKYTTEEGLPGDEILSVAEDAEDKLWCVTDKGVSSFDGTRWRIYTVDDGFPRRGVTRVIVASDNVKWFGTSDNGIFSYDGAKVTGYSTNNSEIPDNYIQDMAFDSDGVLWLSCGRSVVNFPGYGLIRFDGKAWKQYMTEGPPSNIVRGVHVDDNNVKWFWTNAGLSIFDGLYWSRYTGEDYLSVWQSEIVYVTDLDGVRWFVISGRACSYDGVQRKYFTKADGLASDSVLDIAADANNVKWFCTDHGVSSFDGTTWMTYDAGNGFTDALVQSVTVDEDNTKWFAVPDKGLWRYDNHEWSVFTASNSELNSDYVINIAADRNGFIWIAMSFGWGLQSFNGVNWKTHTETVNNAQILSIGVDQDNVKWFGTYDGGIIKYDDCTSQANVTQRHDAGGPESISSWPNPLNSTTFIQFNIPSEGFVTLQVYSVTGQKVKTLLSSNCGAGYHKVAWNGKNDYDVLVSSGMYHFVVRLNNRLYCSRKCLFIK